MSIEKLKRVCARMRQRNPGKDSISRMELERAIMLECGTAAMTYHSNRLALEKLNWISRRGRRFKLTGKDLTEDV